MANILVFCAHNDDNIIGVGGTVAAYAAEGHHVLTIIFSYGEQSHPHLKAEIVREKRIKESLVSNELLGGSGITYLGLAEGNFLSASKEIRTMRKLRYILMKYRAEKIFTHSKDDPHPDHRAVNTIIINLCRELSIRSPIYSFDVWNLLNIRNRNLPKLIVDTSNTFMKKMEALRAHESQIYLPLVYFLFWKIYIKDWLTGFTNHCTTAEMFTRIR